MTATISTALAHESMAVRAGGQWRCKACGSTVYLQVNDVVRQRDSPPMYSLEWVCWMGGHVLKQQWYTGSPVPRAKPVDPVAQIDVGRKRTVRETATRLAALIKLDTERGQGCGQACRLVQYTDPTKVHSAVYETIMHDPLTHEQYGKSQVEGSTVGAESISYNGMEIDLKTMRVSVDGRELTGANAPTPTEWKLLYILATKIGRVLTQKEILTRVWGTAYGDSSHLLRVNMARLRKKLDENSPDRFIRTRPGVGYALGLDYTQEAKPVYGVVDLADDDDAE